MGMKFAVIETGGKQYKVAPGEKIKVEKLNGAVGEAAVFNKVLLTADGSEVAVGQPYLKGSEVGGKILGRGRHDKKIVFRYHSKTRYRKKKGHRQPYTEVEILKIK